MTAKGLTKEAFDLKIVYLYRLNFDTSLGAEPIAYLETASRQEPLYPYWRQTDSGVRDPKRTTW